MASTHGATQIRVYSDFEDMHVAHGALNAIGAIKQGVANARDSDATLCHVDLGVVSQLKTADDVLAIYDNGGMTPFVAKEMWNYGHIDTLHTKIATTSASLYGSGLKVMENHLAQRQVESYVLTLTQKANERTVVYKDRSQQTAAFYSIDYVRNDDGKWVLVESGNNLTHFVHIYGMPSVEDKGQPVSSYDNLKALFDRFIAPLGDGTVHIFAGLKPGALKKQGHDVVMTYHTEPHLVRLNSLVHAYNHTYVSNVKPFRFCVGQLLDLTSNGVGLTTTAGDDVRPTDFWPFQLASSNILRMSHKMTATFNCDNISKTFDKKEYGTYIAHKGINYIQDPTIDPLNLPYARKEAGDKGAAIAYKKLYKKLNESCDMPFTQQDLKDLLDRSREVVCKDLAKAILYALTGHSCMTFVECNDVAITKPAVHKEGFNMGETAFKEEIRRVQTSKLKFIFEEAYKYIQTLSLKEPVQEVIVSPPVSHVQTVESNPGPVEKRPRRVPEHKEAEDMYERNAKSDADYEPEVKRVRPNPKTPSPRVQVRYTKRMYDEMVRKKDAEITRWKNQYDEMVRTKDAEITRRKNQYYHILSMSRRA